MEAWYYEVVSIDGDYANLKRTDIESDDLKLVARALLPQRPHRFDPSGSGDGYDRRGLFPAGTDGDSGHSRQHPPSD